MAFSMNAAMPEPFAQGAFVGEHGSWNRDQFNGYKVVYIPFENGEPAGMAQDVVTGFIEGDQAYGRPVGVGIDGTGALLIADDAGNTVWRVAAADGSVTPEPIGTDMTVAAGAAEGVQPEGGEPPAAADAELGQEEPVEPSGETASPEPSQTDVAPAVLPEGTVGGEGRQ
jgi:hypothetical protein